MSTAEGFEPGDPTRRDEPDLRPSRAVAISDWLVRRASSFLSTRSSRRGFLVGIAVTGSAVAAAGVKFATRPGTAYAADHRLPAGLAVPRRLHRVLLHDQRRAEQLSAGLVRRWLVARRLLELLQRNSLLHRLHAGLLRARGSRGRILRRCIECQCGGGCDTRTRVLQLLPVRAVPQEIAESGPIACRVVTCVPPYLSDPACSPVSAVDNRTAEHTAACLTINPPISIVIIQRKGRNVIQVSLYGTLNVFYVAADGTLMQKAYSPTFPLADRNGWITSRLTAAGRCQVGSDVDAQDGFQNNFHLFATAADGNGLVHLTWVRSQSRWVEQTH